MRKTEDKKWHIWTLSEGDIDETSDRELTPDQKEMVAQDFKKRIETLLGDGYTWSDILRDSIRDTLEDG